MTASQTWRIRTQTLLDNFAVLPQQAEPAPWAACLAVAGAVAAASASAAAAAVPLEDSASYTLPEAES